MTKSLNHAQIQCSRYSMAYGQTLASMCNA